MSSTNTAKILATLLVVATLPLLFNRPASALDLIGVGGITFTDPQAEPPVAYHAQATFGGGVFADFAVTPFLHLESGLLLMPRKYEAQSISVDTEQSFSSLQFPVLVRLSPTDFFSVGIGPYLALPTGRFKEVTRTKIGNASVTVDRTFEQAGLRTTELGLQASARIEWPVLPEVGAVLDFRYLHEFTNSSSRAGVTLQFTELQFLAGGRVSLL